MGRSPERRRSMMRLPLRAEGYRNTVVNDSDGATIALYPGGGPVEEVRANAALIVAAVNHHHDLIRACRWLLRFLNHFAVGEEAKDFARRTLACAQGGYT